MIIVDAGSRYGLHPTLNPFLGLSEIYLFEPDKDESERLKIKYQSLKNVHVYDCGLGSKESELVLNIKEHPALNTTRDVNKELFDSSQRKQQQVSVATEVIKINRLDNLLNRRPDFFKLDIEGMELDALEGAGDLIEGITGIRCEVQLQAVHQGCSTFSEIDKWLKDKNFELISLDNLLAGRLTNNFSSSLEDGKLLSCDGVWINKNYLSSTISISQLLKSCLWLFCNGMGAESISTLENYFIENKPNNFVQEVNTNEEVKTMANILRKMMLEQCLKASLPNQNLRSHLNELYYKLFGKEIPAQHLIRYEIATL